MPRTIDVLIEQLGADLHDLAARCQLPVDRVERIVDGRWTPSPSERAKIAAALGVDVEAISWGHSMNPRNVRYRRFGLHSPDHQQSSDAE